MTSISFCEGWEGRAIDGKFPLLEWLGGSGDRGAFLTVLRGTQTACIKLILAEGEHADAYLAQWEAAKALSHPNLVHLIEAGRCTIDGKDLVYVVTERAEAVLAGTIPRKSLDPQKAKRILDSIVDALSYIHEKGFVHRHIKPSNILLVADEWKLSVDSLLAASESSRPHEVPGIYDAPEVAEGQRTAAADVWSLGMTMAEALMERPPAWDRTAQIDPAMRESMLEPFLEIVRQCLRADPGKRCTIAEIKELLARDFSTTVVADSASGKAEGAPVVDQPIPVPAEQVPVASAPVEVTEDKGAEAKETVEDRIPVSVETSEEVEDPLGEEMLDDEDDLEPEEEPIEPSPTSRVFANLEENESRLRIGPLLLGLVVLLAIVAVYLVRSHKINLPIPVQTQTAQQTTAPSEAKVPSAAGPETPQPQTPLASPEEGAPAAAQPEQPAPGSQPDVASTAGESKSGAGTGPATPQTQVPAASTNEKQSATTESAAATSKVAPAPKVASPPAPPEVVQAANAEGEVAKRVLPSVSAAARSSMRAPVEVEVQVSVNENGAVSAAEYVSPGAGNYFARISHQAARSWKFKAPMKEGNPKASTWTLRFHFDRDNTEASATELR